MTGVEFTDQIHTDEKQELEANYPRVSFRDFYLLRGRTLDEIEELAKDYEAQPSLVTTEAKAENRTIIHKFAAGFIREARANFVASDRTDIRGFCVTIDNIPQKVFDTWTVSRRSLIAEYLARKPPKKEYAFSREQVAKVWLGDDITQNAEKFVETIANETRGFQLNGADNIKSNESDPALEEYEPKTTSIARNVHIANGKGHQIGVRPNHILRCDSSRFIVVVYDFLTPDFESDLAQLKAFLYSSFVQDLMTNPNRHNIELWQLDNKRVRFFYKTIDNSDEHYEPSFRYIPVNISPEKGIELLTQYSQKWLAAKDFIRKIRKIDDNAFEPVLKNRTRREPLLSGFPSN